ncbi:MAG: site-2 protease family protein, partial [Candidatus Contendobacter sp.]|nr:site-2 protease family protein [Candidatus Contendobacter sp.]
MQELNDIQFLVVMAPPLLLAITLHEVAHGWMALRCGDTTA